ncbi:unnamed protein product [Linum trigynum]|uniref:Uncharacterized protein n=1 Tax=Linum trigynum TaxID=586398 RepID=A0AAV2DTR6_9ROSI
MERVRYIEVEEKGITERLMFLDHYLTVEFFSIQNRGLPDELESDFIEWARVNWKLNDDFAFTKEVEDLWMLASPSLQEVIRMQSCRRTTFREYNIIVWFWKEDVGRCFAPQKGLTWIMAIGIPHHLRSLDVYKKIGELCGGFIDINRS